MLELAHKMKADPPAYYDALPNETLLMLFEKPSLRTRVSLEVGMTELGGHAIAYMIGDSPLGKKETFGDTAACLSRFVAAVTARVNSRESITCACHPCSVCLRWPDHTQGALYLSCSQGAENSHRAGSLQGSDCVL